MLFHVGSMCFGLELSFIKSVHRITDLSDSITTSKSLNDNDHIHYCLLDGNEIPLYDFPIILGSKNSYVDAGFQKIMHLETSLQNMALKVDHVDKVVEAEDESIIPLPPMIKGKSLKWFPFLLKYDNNLIPLLNPNGMIEAKLNFFKLEKFFSSIIHKDKVTQIITKALKQVIQNTLNKELKKIKIIAKNIS